MATEELLQLALRWIHAASAASFVGLLHALAWARAGEGRPAWRGASIAAWLRGVSLAAFVAGLALLVLLYGSGHFPYLDAGGERPSPSLLAGSLAGLCAGAAAQELLVRAGTPGRILAPWAVLSAGLAFAAWLERLGASRRAMYVHAGALVATALVAASWSRLAPALARGDEDAVALRSAARLSLPVVLLMLAADQPGLTGHDPWALALGSVLAVGYSVGLCIERGLDR